MCDKWQQLSEELSKEAALLGARNSPENLRRLAESDRAVALEDAGRIIAFAALWDTDDPRWFELGSVWVHPEHRGRGLASTVFRRLAYLVKHNTFLVTHNPSVVHLALSVGWRELDKGTWLLVPWSITCGPCDRWGSEEEKRICPFLADPLQCRLLCT